MITAAIGTERFSAGVVVAAVAFGTCSATALFPRKPAVPLFHLTEKYARVERNRVYQPLEMTEQ